jgi:ADP-ribosyl-[dinitrogen reductase] hydrolase
VDPDDRVVGCVLGLALGDALGAPFEFRRSAEIPDAVPALELPWMGLPPGSTTDDTAMALNLVESLTACGGFDADDLVERHAAWFRTDPPDVGNLTRRVLRVVADGTGAGGAGAAASGTPRAQAPASAATVASSAARSIWERRGPEVSAGNGSVMYCAPLGAAYATRPEALFELAPALSGLTHHDPRCRTACLAVTLAVAALVRGDPPRPALHAALAAVQDRDGGEELEFLTEAVGVSRPVDGPDQGFCLYAAACGLQAVLRAGPFDDEVRRIVAMGGDTDTNGAVAGALIGARDGIAGLPDAWMHRLVGRDAIARKAGGMVALARTAPS